MESKHLIGLKPGAILTVRLRSGRELEARLLERPSQVAVGQPGAHRFRLRVLDIEGHKKISDRASIFRKLDFQHTVTGLQVIAIKTPEATAPSKEIGK